MGRFTGRTNAPNRLIENVEAAVAIHSMYYNFARVRQSLRVTPVTAADVTNRLWTVEDIAGLAD